MKIKYEVYNKRRLIAELSEEGSLFPLIRKYAYIKKFCKNILSVGGQRVSIPLEDILHDEIELINGKLIKYSEIIKNKHRRVHDCHANSARFWEKNKDTCKLVTGYALLRTAWISHTWVITNKKQIVDSGLQADKYYGVILDDIQAEQFCKKVLQKN